MFGTEMKVALRGLSAVLVMGLLATAAARANESAISGVVAVSDAFYTALNDMMVGTPVSGDIAPLWLNAEGVTAQHPIGGRDTGLDSLLGAFDGVASLATGGTIAIEDQAIAVFDDTAVETGVEIGTTTLAGEDVPLEYRVTNVYTLTDEGWRMVHHHTDLSTPIIELLTRLNK